MHKFGADGSYVLSSSTKPVYWAFSIRTKALIFVDLLLKVFHDFSAAINKTRQLIFLIWCEIMGIPRALDSLYNEVH